MIDHNRRLLFIHIARTGGTSIESALIGKDWWNIEPDTKHLSARQARTHYGEEIWNTYTTFSVVRNPWDRIVSMWATKSWHRALNMDLDCSLEYFIKNLRPHPNEAYNSLLYCEILDDDIDSIIRFENLQEDFSRMLHNISTADITLPHKEQQQRKGYKEVLNETEKRLIGTIFEKDIQTFGYKF